MKYKLLVLSISMLGYVGCASHPTQLQSNAALNEKVYRSYEQLVSKQSYAFDGKMTFQIESARKAPQITSQNIPEKTKQSALLDQLFVQQKTINLQQQQWMKDGLEQKSGSLYTKKSPKFEQLLESFLNRYYYSFDGVVDLKNGQISMNPKVGYAAKNAQGWIAVPLALDLKNLKAYADISALSPIVTDPKYDGQYVVFDFQNIAKKENLNVRPLLELVRESMLLNAALAGEEQYKKLPLTAMDTKLGASERIQYSGTYNDLMAQYFLFFYLNENYLKSIAAGSKLNSSLGALNPMDLALGKTSQFDQLSSSLNSSNSENTDSAAIYRLYDAIDGVITDADKVSSNTLQVSEDFAAPLPKLANESDMEREAETENASSTASQNQTDTFAKFADYKTDKLITAQRMKQIINEQPQAYQELLHGFADEFKQLEVFGTSYTTALVLDQKGRLIRAEMDIAIGGLKEIGIEKIITKTEMNIHNYGTAKVDQQQLRNAVSFKEAANENSMLNLGKLWDKYLGEEKTGSSLKEKNDESALWSRTQRYEKLAESLFQQNLSFLDAYAELYRYAYILEGDDTEYDEFNFKDLNDTARWTAVYYADEFGLDLTAKQKAEYENSPEEWYYYDEYIAEAVWKVIDAEQKQHGLKKTLNQLRKQGKTDAQIFSQLYLDIETKNEQRTTGESNVKFTPEYHAYVKVLGEVAIEDIKKQEIDIEKLRKFDQRTLDRVNSSTYKQVYKLFM